MRGFKYDLVTRMQPKQKTQKGTMKIKHKDLNNLKNYQTKSTKLLRISAVLDTYNDNFKIMPNQQERMEN